MKENLLKVIEILKKGWTKGVYARDIYGNPCLVNSKEASKYCVMGALNYIIENKYGSNEYVDLLLYLADNVVPGNSTYLAIWNDNLDQDRVVSRLQELADSL